MKRLVLLVLISFCAAAAAQTNVRVRGTITALNGDVLSVKSRDGRAIQLHLAPDARFADDERQSDGDRAGERRQRAHRETIFSGARAGEDGKHTTQRVAVSKDGVKPPQ